MGPFTLPQYLPGMEPPIAADGTSWARLSSTSRAFLMVNFFVFMLYSIVRLGGHRRRPLLRFCASMGLMHVFRLNLREPNRIASDEAGATAIGLQVSIHAAQGKAVRCANL